jgi:outer membrane murein-binding lipoprotein Lpp
VGERTAERLTDKEREMILDALASPDSHYVGKLVRLHDALAVQVGTLEVQLADIKRQLVTAMEQARAAEKKANRLGHELEAARTDKATDKAAKP